MTEREHQRLAPTFQAQRAQTHQGQLSTQVLEHGFERGLPSFALAVVHHAAGFRAQAAAEVAHGFLARATTQGQQRVTRNDHSLTGVGHADLAAAEIELQSIRRIEVEAHGWLTAGAEPGAFRKYRVAWVNSVNSPANPGISEPRAGSGNRRLSKTACSRIPG